MLKRIWIFISLVLIAGICVAADPKFYSDDPIKAEPDPEDASGVEERDINLIYDLAENLFYKPGDKALNLRAKNINTIDEVPDSNWFTNRTNLTVDAVAKGPNTTNGPATGNWEIISGKNDGVSPGFTIKDSTGTVWFVKPDPPGYLGMATGAEVSATKLFWALGFNVPETHVANMSKDQLVIAETATVKTLSGKRRKLKEKDVNSMLRRAAKNPDGTYRVMASKALDGNPVGGFRFYGTRPDDPNDIFPHEHRRELRGYYVFAAWLNHVDCKALQSLDTLVSEGGRSYVRHHLLDFSSTQGSGSIYPHEYWEGYEQIMEKPGHIGKDLISFGFLVEPYRTDPFYKADSVGRIPDIATQWDPDTWEPRVSNSAFKNARLDDKFWAATKLIPITNDMIRAAIQSGQLNDPESEDTLVRILGERRDAILRRYLPAMTPVVNPQLGADGALTFENIAVNASVAGKPELYQALWYQFDNASGNTTRIGGTTGQDTSIPAPGKLPDQTGAYVKVEISAKSAANPAWETPVHVYFAKTGDGWKLVGLERMPEDGTETTTETAAKSK